MKIYGEEDTIVYADYSVGSIAAIHFKENQVYFYNEENWGAEEAYRAFEPKFTTAITKDFIENCSDRVWVIDNVWGNAVEKIFNKTDYKIVSEKNFYTNYHDYSYKIILLEK